RDWLGSETKPAVHGADPAATDPPGSHRGHSIVGWVIDDEGRAVSDAQVRWRVDDRTGVVPVDSEGRFEVRDLPVGCCVFRASAAGHLDSPSVAITVPDVSDPPFLQLTRSIELRARVVDLHGGGVRRARVWLQSQGFPRIERTTDDRGKFTASIVPRRWVTVEIRSEAGLSCREFVQADSFPDEFVLRGPSGIRIVPNPDLSTSLERLRVGVKESGTSTGYETVELNARGVSIPLAPGGYEIVVDEARYARLETRVEIPAETMVELVYPPNAGAGGNDTVEVRGDGRPLPGARVTLSSILNSGAPWCISALTGTDGRVVVAGLREPAAELRVECPSFLPFETSHPEGCSAGSIIEVVLEPMATISVTVRGEPDRLGRAFGVTVRPTSRIWDGLPAVVRGRTDANGTVMLQCSGLGPHEVRLTRGGETIARSTVVVRAGDTIDVDFDPSSRVVSRGRVLVSGRPTGGGTLFIDRGEALESIELTATGEFEGRWAPGDRIHAHYRSLDANAMTVNLGEAEVAIDGSLVFDYPGYELTLGTTPNGTPTRGRRTFLLEAVDGSGHRGRAFAIGESPAIVSGVPTARYRVTLLPAPEDTASASEQFVDVPNDHSVEFEVEPGRTIGPMPNERPGAVSVRRVEDSGHCTLLSCASEDPLLVVWPRSLSGTGVIESGGSAPSFFEVRPTGTVYFLPSAPGGEIDSSPLAALEWAGLRFRLVPLGSNQGPPDYWRHRVFAPSGIDHVSVPAGRYRITIFDEQGDLDTFEREVAPGAVTRLVR
ncbi:MAG: carboxypeptidase regulatory-like domain-containing protein, partial [Planctomycetes bacterium]|nr:carboxypeptidase regulatory-like domain-containing protein [Planctomycetota bacterium]